MLSVVDNEPRVLDVALAEQLEMARPTNIRSLIESSMEELEGFGPVARGECNVPMPRGGFKKSTAFYLNRQEALVVCILSRTERAKEARAEVIRHFDAYEQLTATPRPQLLNFSNPAEAARAWAEQYEFILRAGTMSAPMQCPWRPYSGIQGLAA